MKIVGNKKKQLIIKKNFLIFLDYVVYTPVVQVENMVNILFTKQIVSTQELPLKCSLISVSDQLMIGNVSNHDEMNLLHRSSSIVL